MKNKYWVGFGIVVGMMSCHSTHPGELLGVRKSNWKNPNLYGLVPIPGASFSMGNHNQDLFKSFDARAKTITVSPFYMDDSEITNDEYRQFVFWVRDSVRSKILNAFEKEITPVKNNFTLSDNNDDGEEILSHQGYYTVWDNGFENQSKLNPHCLIYLYYWMDLKKAAQDSKNPVKTSKLNHLDYIKKEEIAIYPDTLCWVRDYTYSFNEPMTKNYFSHPAYDHYPVVGVSWDQAKAFSVWRTQLMANGSEKSHIEDFRLPTEAEWEWASRGGLPMESYPWKGIAKTDETGAFMANFKTGRGNYYGDGAVQTEVVYSRKPNDYGLYAMAGNVAEWTSTTYAPSGYEITHDLNPELDLDCGDLPCEWDRKVVRGGAWKDIAYFTQVGVRTYEFKDTSKSYIGFRNVVSRMGM